MSESEVEPNVDQGVDQTASTDAVPPEESDAENAATGESAAADDSAAAGESAATDEAAGDTAEREKRDPAEEYKAQLRAQDGDWYVIHSYAGYENRVKTNLQNRIVSLNMEDFIFQIEVPMEDVVEIKNSVKKQVRRVRIPGYVLVRMNMSDESWGAVRHTPGVTGFVGSAYNPVPLTTDEVFRMLDPVFESEETEKAEAAGGKEKASPVQVEFEVGESIMVKEGSFEGHPATVTEIKPENQKLVVLLSIFERDVPVELAFNQVSKI